MWGYPCTTKYREFFIMVKLRTQTRCWSLRSDSQDDAAWDILQRYVSVPVWWLIYKHTERSITRQRVLAHLYYLDIQELFDIVGSTNDLS